MLCTQLCSFVYWWPRFVTASSQRISLSQLLTNSTSSTRHFVFHKCYQGSISEALWFYSPPFTGHTGPLSKPRKMYIFSTLRKPTCWGSTQAIKNPTTLLFQLQENLLSCRKIQATNAEILHPPNTADKGFHSTQTCPHSIYLIVETVEADHV